jgi:5-methylcytosine-specific restriction endonuclease McrA
MPIDYKKYPPNWKTEIRPRILKRAEHKCEFCGIENYAINPRGSKVVLTIAHLDHDPENWNVTDDRLKALCQKCHFSTHNKEKS